MKKHNGMRPHDVIIILKIISDEKAPLVKELSDNLGISLSEISDSIGRSVFGGLLANDRKTPIRKVFYDFLIHGFSVVFPVKPAGLVRGMPTSHSAPPLNKEFDTSEIFVWADPKGEVRGQQIDTLHPGQVEAAKKDQNLYELLALIDALRVGKAREKAMAKVELKKRILG